MGNDVSRVNNKGVYFVIALLSLVALMWSLVPAVVNSTCVVNCDSITTIQQM